MELKRGVHSGMCAMAIANVLSKFEHAVILVLSGLIPLVVALAVWNLVLKVVASIVLSGGFDPTDYSVFQALFRDDLHGHHRSGVQALTTGGLGATTRCRTGSHRCP